MQLRVKPNAWITASGLSPACTLSTARIRISCNVLWSRARASRRFMPAIVIYVYLLMNILISVQLLLGVGGLNGYQGYVPAGRDCVQPFAASCLSMDCL